MAYFITDGKHTSMNKNNVKLYDKTNSIFAET